MNISVFIKRYPVWIYFILTFAISWGGFLLVVGPGNFLGTPEQFEIMLPISVLAMLVGPSVAGILLTGLVSGRTGLRELISRLLKWRVDVRWYVVALLPAPILTMVVLFSLSLSCPIFTADNKITIFLSGIAFGLTTVFEELGWTGFAVPRLRRKYRIVSTGLIVGILWGVWHFLQILWVSGIYSGEISLPLFFLLYILFSIAQLTACRVFLVWIYDRTESLLVTTLMHASFTASTTIIFRPLETGVTFLIFGWVLAAVLWIAVAALIFFKKTL